MSAAISRRGVFQGAAALALGLGVARRAKACSAVVLDDYCANGVHDVSAALRAGPVELLARDYECLPVRFAPRDVLRGVPGRSRLLFEANAPAFSPVAPDQPTDSFTFEDFDVQCEAPGAVGAQSGFYLASCRRFWLRRITVSDFAGSGVLVYGQRIAFLPGPGAPSIDRPCGWVGDEWQCGGVRAPSDATMGVVEDLNIRRCWIGIHLTGTPAPEGVPRVKGGAANMHSIIRPICSNNRSDGIQIWQGASNYVEKPILGQNARHGIALGWYNNLIPGATCERNGGWGIWRAPVKEQRGNEWPNLHDGGSNGLGLVSPDSSALARREVGR